MILNKVKRIVAFATLILMASTAFASDSGA